MMWRATLRAVMTLFVLLGLATTFASKATSATSPSTPSRGPTNKERIRLAQREATHLLAVAAVPPGARVLSTWLRIRGHELSAPMSSYGSPDVVDETHYFVQSASTASTTWIDTYVPTGATRSGTGSGNTGIRSWTFDFAGTGVLSTQVLEYTSQSLPDGRLEWRIDAQVVWTPQKSQFAFIGLGTVRVRAQLTGPLGTAYRSTASVTTSDVSVIAKIRSLVNQLPVANPGAMSCPMDNGELLTLTFYRAKQSAPFARVAAHRTGCGTVDVEQLKANGAILGRATDQGGYVLTTRVAALVGLQVPAGG